jgi:hypothetical protein
MTTDKHRSTQIDTITGKIIACAYTVSNTLGSGFLEKVYENAMIIELRENELTVEVQKPLDVKYKAQLINYLNACNIRYGLILNFGNPKVEIKRLVNGY